MVQTTPVLIVSKSAANPGDGVEVTFRVPVAISKPQLQLSSKLLFQQYVTIFYQSEIIENLVSY
jgi:hypothetical protein